MYELQNINKNLTDKFYQAIFKAMEKTNWDNIACRSVELTFHEMLPNFPKHTLEKYIKAVLIPILETKKKNFQIRDFIDDEEKEEVYENTYGDLINDLMDSKEIEDKHNLDLIHYIYDLLEYDRVIIIDNEKLLYSYIYINAYANIHLEAYEKLKISYENKPQNQNIDIATNNSKDIKSKISFLNPMLKPIAQNKHDTNHKSAQLKLDFLKNYEEEYRITARSVHELHKLKEHSDNFEIDAIGSLEPQINADSHITNHDLYISWYAHVYKIYTYAKIPPTKKLKLAQLSSYVLFPNLRGKETLLVQPKMASKPIREIAFYKGLRLLEFTNNHTKIKKTDDEIEFTEEYLSTITKHLNQLS